MLELTINQGLTEIASAVPTRARVLDSLAPPERDLCDRTDLARLVRSFYRRAATDDVLGPVFTAAGVDWPAHIAKLVDFWSWQLLGARGYEGNPLRAHEPLQAATPFGDEHYRRWLEIFEDTVDELFLGPTAEVAKTRARKMANALRRLLDGTSRAGESAVEVIRSRAPRAGSDPAHRL